MGMHGVVSALLGNAHPALHVFELLVKLSIPGNSLSRFSQLGRY